MKLYKYRSLKNYKLNESYIDFLKENYLWFADILSLNDSSDSTIYCNSEEEAKIFSQEIERYKIQVVKHITNNILSKFKNSGIYSESLLTDRLLFDILNFNENYRKTIKVFSATDSYKNICGFFIQKNMGLV